MRHPVLHPSDVAVALQIALEPGQTFSDLGGAVGLDAATAHRSLARLQRAQLVLPGERRAAMRALIDFLVHGARYAFFPVFGSETLGIPTAHSGPALTSEFPDGDPVVWPSVVGTAHGRALQPLYGGAPSLPNRNPRLYEALTLVDALRAGRARERSLAAEKLEAMLNDGADDDREPGPAGGNRT